MTIALAGENSLSDEISAVGGLIRRPADQTQELILDDEILFFQLKNKTGRVLACWLFALDDEHLALSTWGWGTPKDERQVQQVIEWISEEMTENQKE